MRNKLVCASALAGCLLTAPAARAQGGPFLTGPTYGQPNVEDSPESGEATLSTRSVKLFDLRRTTRSYVLDIGPIWHRQAFGTNEQARTGFERGAPLAGEIALGSTFQTPQRPFFLVGSARTILRVLDDKSFSWSIFHQDLGGGLMIGPFEPEVKIGLSILTADIFHAQPSIQLFTPRVAAGVGIHVGRVRLDVKMHAEYLWRWFGPDYLVRGITLGVRLDLPRATRRTPGATD